MNPRLLVVEDDPAIGPELAHALRGQGYQAELATSARRARQLALASPADLVLLDLGLPDLDGVPLCRELRQLLPDAVIVMLTARSEEIDVVVGLDAGADDYLTKPFRLTELLARVRAHLRRGTASAGQTPQPPVTVGPVRVDGMARRAYVGDRELALRPKEFDLLATLLAAAGTALARETLMGEVWDRHWHGSTKTLDMHVSALRRKLADAGGSPEWITTLRGYGYRYERTLPGSSG